MPFACADNRSLPVEPPCNLPETLRFVIASVQRQNIKIIGNVPLHDFLVKRKITLSDSAHPDFRVRLFLPDHFASGFHQIDKFFRRIVPENAEAFEMRFVPQFVLVHPVAIVMNECGEKIFPVLHFRRSEGGIHRQPAVLHTDVIRMRRRPARRSADAEQDSEFIRDRAVDQRIGEPVEFAFFRFEISPHAAVQTYKAGTEEFRKVVFQIVDSLLLIEFASADCKTEPARFLRSARGG